MRWLLVLRLRLRSLFRGAAADRELDDELRYHLDRQVEHHIARGMTPADARTAALRALGGVEQRKEEMRDQRRVNAIENISRDIRIALRQLRKQPAFTVAAIVSLALGIGANTAIFHLLNALSFRSLPIVESPHELVEVRLTGSGRFGRHTGRNRQVSLPQYQELARRQQAFSSMLAFGDTRFNLAPAGEVRYVEGLWVSGSFFDTLGVRPGTWTAPDHRRRSSRMRRLSRRVISYALWQASSAAAPMCRPDLPLASNAWRSWRHTAGLLWRRGRRPVRRGAADLFVGLRPADHWWLATIGRLKPGWTREQAAAQLSRCPPRCNGSRCRTIAPNWRPPTSDGARGVLLTHHRACRRCACRISVRCGC